MIRTYIVPLLAIAGLAAAVAMVVRDSPAAPVARPLIQQPEAPFPSYLSAPGVVEASSGNIAVGTPVSGIVAAIYVTWGDHVNVGDPLFRIDTRDLEARLPGAVARVDAAQATLDKARNRLKVGERLGRGVSISAEALADRRYDVALDEAALESANADVQQVRVEIDRRTVRALVEGRILQINTRLGEFAQGGPQSTPLMILGDDTVLDVRVDIDENDAWRFRPCASAVVSERGNPALKTKARFVRTEPLVVPKVQLTGDGTERTDTRVLQVIYSFPREALPVYVGQQMDVSIDAPPVEGSAPALSHSSGSCAEAETGEAASSAAGTRSR